MGVLNYFPLSLYQSSVLLCNVFWDPRSLTAFSQSVLTPVEHKKKLLQITFWLFERDTRSTRLLRDRVRCDKLRWRNIRPSSQLLLQNNLTAGFSNSSGEVMQHPYTLLQHEFFLWFCSTPFAWLSVSVYSWLYYLIFYQNIIQTK